MNKVRLISLSKFAGSLPLPLRLLIICCLFFCCFKSWKLSSSWLKLHINQTNMRVVTNFLSNSLQESEKCAYPKISNHFFNIFQQVFTGCDLNTYVVEQWSCCGGRFWFDSLMEHKIGLAETAQIHKF